MSASEALGNSFEGLGAPFGLNSPQLPLITIVFDYLRGIAETVDNLPKSIESLNTMPLDGGANPCRNALQVPRWII